MAGDLIHFGFKSEVNNVTLTFGRFERLDKGLHLLEQAGQEPCLVWLQSCEPSAFELKVV